MVSGRGIQILREHGIEVTEHILEDECTRLNEVFFHYIRTKRPFVVMKYAMTLDGKIAAYTGASKWVTGEQARDHVQEQRHRYTGIMVGVGTVLADDPLLTCRKAGCKNPIRVICDTDLRTPLTAQVVTTAKQAPTILVTCCADREKWTGYEEAGCRILPTERKNGRIDLERLMERLGQEGIDSILLEGGGTLNWAALESGIVQKVPGVYRAQVVRRTDGKNAGRGRWRTVARLCVPVEKHGYHAVGGGHSAGKRGGKSCLPGLLKKLER